MVRTKSGVEQQQLQSIQRLRELAIKSQNASQKQIVSLLLELNIRLPNTQGGILRGLEGVLEDICLIPSVPLSRSLKYNMKT